MTNQQVLLRIDQRPTSSDLFDFLRLRETMKHHETMSVTMGLARMFIYTNFGQFLESSHMITYTHTHIYIVCICMCIYIYKHTEYIFKTCHFPFWVQ